MNQAIIGYDPKTKQPIFGPGYQSGQSEQIPPLSGGFKDLFGKLWNKNSGIAKVGKIANIGGGVYQGGKALSNLISLNAAGDDLDTLRSDILASAYNNPLSNDYLSADQKKLLRELKSGSYSSKTASNALGAGFGGALTSLPKALINAGLGFVTGGIPGAAIQGIGTLTNAGIQGATSSKSAHVRKADSKRDRRPLRFSDSNLR